MGKSNGKANGHAPEPLSKKEAARLIARGDQLGYKTVKVGRRETLVPVNRELQIMFESELAQFRQE